MEKLEEYTGLPAHKLTQYGVRIACVMVMCGLGGSGIVTAMGIIYPTLKSFLALDPKSSKGEDKQWLTYWVIFGIFNIVDQYAGIIL